MSSLLQHFSQIQSISVHSIVKADVNVLLKMQKKFQVSRNSK